jgi:hypothetical protein
VFSPPRHLQVEREADSPSSCSAVFKNYELCLHFLVKFNPIMPLGGSRKRLRATEVRKEFVFEEEKKLKDFTEEKSWAKRGRIGCFMVLVGMSVETPGIAPSTVKMEAAHFSETSSLYKTTRRHIPHYPNIQWTL